jgi:uncharacterized cupredoxin-like copper-binding protein
MLKTQTVGAALLLLAGCAAPAPQPESPPAAADTDWAHAQPVSVRLSDFMFTPDHLVFPLGRPVRLTLVNDGSGRHDFSAPEFFATAALRGETRKPAAGKIAVDAGQTVEIDFVPSKVGSYKLDCTELLHAMFGMTGSITVAVATPELPGR